MKKPILQAALALAFLSAVTAVGAADAARQADVARAVAISYRDVPAGAELAYRTADPAHAWFDAQVSDHGRDARSGHPGAHGKHHQ